MDVKIMFLNGIIEEELYIKQPQGFEVNGKESHVCKLKEALYRLKQANRAWYSRMDGYLQSIGFTFDLLILVLYVDEIFLTSSAKLIAGCKADMATKFEMKDIGLMHYFLGLEVWQKPGEIFLMQGK